ncbi:GMC family oxidoreductase N-terminal domain-containing protein [Acidobacteria bacterium AH-259-D05]|nr:GMC family oxidoreductase N-terminal domain-containing protein [Acidobacteria bacterium AH-259-D05]
MPDYETFDVIVVGAGTAGTILASRIAENGVNPSTGDRLKVGLLEGGPYYLEGGPLQPGIGDPTRRRMITNIKGDETDPPKWHYDGFNIKAVGGCSLHWGSNAFLPIPKDFANWRRATGVNWGPGNRIFQEAIDEAVKMYHVHPIDTFYSKPRPKTLNKGGQMFADAARTLGHQVNAPQDPREKGITGLSRVNCILCGYCGRGHYCKYDSKITGLFYLKLIGEENGLQVIPDAEVDHIIIEKERASFVAKGIAYTRYGEPREARAPRVIVSCGTSGTPVLLYRSGYGPKDLLGQRLMVENNNVGRHLDGDLVGASLDMITLFGEDIHIDEGNPSTLLVHEDGDRNKVTLRGVSRITYTNQYPDLLALYPVAPDFGWEHRAYMETAIQRIGVLAISLRAPIWDKGRVGLRGEHLYPRDDPAILNQIHKAWSIARDIVGKLDPQPIKVDDSPPQSFNVLHEVGTCRAGVSRENSVVTPEFDSHDVKSLMICSAAAIPTANHTASHMPTVSVSCYAWRRIVANHFSRGAAPLTM